MSYKISLKLIINEMDSQSDRFSAFFNKNTKKIIFVSEEEFRMAEDEETIDEFQEWLQDQIILAEEILYGNDWIPLPSMFDIHEYNIMERFCLYIEDMDLSNMMYDSIKGRGAFRRFRDNLRKYNIEDDWYNFRAKTLEKIAIEWCEENNISYTI